MTRLTTLYVIDVVAFQCMGNHFHILLHIPAEPPSSRKPHSAIGASTTASGLWTRAVRRARSGR